jgi:hypothetical protein
MTETGAGGEATVPQPPQPDPTGEPEPAQAGASEPPDGGDSPERRDPEVWRLVAVADMSMELPSAFPEIVLHESQHPWRELRIPVALPEGTAIAYAFRSIPTPRPLTHELLTEVLERHGVTIEAVRITGRRGQAFHAEMDTAGPRGRHVVPCRPSDAIALALRQRLPTPVLVAEWVFTGVASEPPDAEGGTLTPVDDAGTSTPAT